MTNPPSRFLRSVCKSVIANGAEFAEFELTATECETLDAITNAAMAMPGKPTEFDVATLLLETFPE